MAALPGRSTVTEVDVGVLLGLVTPSLRNVIPRDILEKLRHNTPYSGPASAYAALSIDGCSLQENYSRVCREVFAGQLSWGRILSLIQFAQSGGKRSKLEGKYEIPLHETRDVLEETKASVTATLTKIERKLKSKRPLSKAEGNSLAQMMRVVNKQFKKGFSVALEGISAIMEAIKDGSLLPKTKGYKALQENFRDLQKAISHPSILHDLASNCYSKGLITAAEKNAAFSTGMDATTLANSFLDLICSRVKRDKKKYDMFLTILRSEPAYENLLILAGGSK